MCMRLNHSTCLALTFLVMSLLSLCASLFYTGKAYAEEPYIEEAYTDEAANNEAQSFAKLMQNIDSMETAFTQKIVDQNNNLIQETEGNLILKRQGQFHWQTFEPFPQQIITDTKTLWIYDPDLEQVVIKAFEQDLLETPILLFSGTAEQIYNTFTVSQEKSTNQGHNIFSLSPKEPGQVYQSILISFSDKQPEKFFIVDSMGQTTQLFFSGATLNKTPDPALFSFQAPEGVEVIYE